MIGFGAAESAPLAASDEDVIYRVQLSDTDRTILFLKVTDLAYNYNGDSVDAFANISWLDVSTMTWYPIPINASVTGIDLEAMGFGQVRVSVDGNEFIYNNEFTYETYNDTKVSFVLEDDYITYLENMANVNWGVTVGSRLIYQTVGLEYEYILYKVTAIEEEYIDVYANDILGMLRSIYPDIDAYIETLDAEISISIPVSTVYADAYHWDVNASVFVKDTIDVFGRAAEDQIIGRGNSEGLIPMDVLSFAVSDTLENDVNYFMPLVFQADTDITELLFGVSCSQGIEFYNKANAALLGYDVPYTEADVNALTTEDPSGYVMIVDGESINETFTADTMDALYAELDAQYSDELSAEEQRALDIAKTAVTLFETVQNNTEIDYYAIEDDALAIAGSYETNHYSMALNINATDGVMTTYNATIPTMSGAIQEYSLALVTDYSIFVEPSEDDSTDDAMPVWGWILIAVGGVSAAGGVIYYFKRKTPGINPEIAVSALEIDSAFCELNPHDPRCHM